MPLNKDAALSLMKAFRPRGDTVEILNGLKCPDCDESLIDSEPSVIHLDPPRKRTKCSKCEYRGFRPIQEKLKPPEDHE